MWSHNIQYHTYSNWYLKMHYILFISCFLIPQSCNKEDRSKSNCSSSQLNCLLRQFKSNSVTRNSTELLTFFLKKISRNPTLLAQPSIYLGLSLSWWLIANPRKYSYIYILLSPPAGRMLAIRPRFVYTREQRAWNFECDAACETRFIYCVVVRSSSPVRAWPKIPPGEFVI